MRYVHTNIVTRDWTRLATFYERVFRCTRVPPERDLSGEWLDRATMVSKAHIRGAHLQLPGYVGTGPTLEIFQYDEVVIGETPVANRLGYGHLAFEVDDVHAVVRRVIAEGGQAVGDVVTREIPGAGVIVFAYVTDPDGNIVEIQCWTR